MTYGARVYSFIKKDEFEKYDLSNVVLDYKDNKKTMKKFSWKAEGKSFLITFAVGMALVLYQEIDTLTFASLKDGALVGVLFGAVRAGFKAVVEMFIALYSSK